MLVRDEGRKHLKEKLVPSPLFHVQLVGLAGQVQGEDLGQKVNRRNAIAAMTVPRRLKKIPTKSTG